MEQLFIAVAADPALPLTEALLDRARACLATCGLVAGPSRWLAAGKAAECTVAGWPAAGVGADVQGAGETLRARVGVGAREAQEARVAREAQAARQALTALFAPEKVDFFLVDAGAPRRKRLLLADMDNTMIVGETLDELAEQCGLKGEVAAITERTMRGELDFAAALRRRVAMLAGLPEAALARTLAAIRPMPGAETLLRTMRANGARCVLVSGGFSCFTAPIAQRLGFHAQHGNQLELRDGLLTGRVLEPIIDSAQKLRHLHQHLAAGPFAAADCLAVGDGANDYPMLAAAGLGVGFHPKPYLQERVANSILHGDLTALLYAQGYRQVEIEAAP